MPRKVKKQTKTDNNTFDLNNEIIIGIKTLPETESKRKKNKTKTKKKLVKKTSKAKKQDEFELKLGIEDDEIKAKRKKAKKVNKNKKKPNKNKKAILGLIKWTTLILILVGGGTALLLSPIFNIEKIEILGNQKLTDDEIISLSKIQLNENTFKLIKSKITKNIKQNAYVENVKINRKLPNTIEIEIEERTPTYMITFANAYAYINNQGYFLEVSKEKLNIPILNGYSTPEEEIHEGNRLCVADLYKLDSVLQIMNTAESNGIAELVTKINITDKQDYVLELEKEKKTVHIGDTANLSTKMLYIKSILEQNKNTEGEILVNTDLNNKGAIFRKKV